MPSSVIDDFLKKKQEIKQHEKTIQQKEKENASRQKQMDNISQKELETDPVKKEEFEKLSQDYKKDAGEIETHKWDKSQKEKELKQEQQKSGGKEAAEPELHQTPHDKSQYGQSLRPAAKLAQPLQQQEQSSPAKEPTPNNQQPKLFGDDPGYEKSALGQKTSEIKGNNYQDDGKKMNAVDEVLAKKETQKEANTVTNTMSKEQQQESLNQMEQDKGRER